jgi:NAD(P)-dependent dehydrogenase (short-subunit alcohol dehydrogenase family)
MTASRFERFDLTGRVAVITGGAGLLGFEHAAAVAEAGGVPVLWDIDLDGARAAADKVGGEWGVSALAARVDITDESAIRAAVAALGRVDILINNAANNPKVDNKGGIESSRLEAFALDAWNKDIAVGLTGAFLCARVIGAGMAGAGKGVILNVASDLGVIAPDQRLYRKDGVPEDQQPVKPVTYSVVKHGLIGLTKYLATYWCDQGVRCNALAPGGVYTAQPDAFVEKLARLIPLGRMANRDEYRGAVQFLCSDASSYMTGACLSVDGGRTTW